MSESIRLGTRGSRLALAQSEQVADSLRAAHPGLHVELVIISTSGDRITTAPLHEFGGKGLFTKELELALLEQRIDFAVHSYKDVPVTMPLVDVSQLVIAATPKRADPRDAIVFPRWPEKNVVYGETIATLPKQARIGTGSLRRRAQLRDLRPDIEVLPLRGNIDTRLRKLSSGEAEMDAMVLARAGLERAGLWDDRCMFPLRPCEMLPAAGQGALALQCRASDPRTRDLLAAVHSPETAKCVNSERDVVRLLGGDCHSPIAALAEIDPGLTRLRAAVGARDGEPPVLRVDFEGALGAGHAERVTQYLIKYGAAHLLKPA